MRSEGWYHLNNADGPQSILQIRILKNSMAVILSMAQSLNLNLRSSILPSPHLYDNSKIQAG